MVLEVDALQRLLLEVLARVLEQSCQTVDFLLEVALALGELLALGLRLVVLGLQIVAASLVDQQVALGYLQVLRALLEPVKISGRVNIGTGFEENTSRL